MDPTSVAGCQRVEHEARPLQQLVNVVSHSTAALLHTPFGRITHPLGQADPNEEELRQARCCDKSLP
jgi:hypothetical protein